MDSDGAFYQLFCGATSKKWTLLRTVVDCCVHTPPGYGLCCELMWSVAWSHLQEIDSAVDCFNILCGANLYEMDSLVDCCGLFRTVVRSQLQEMDSAVNCCGLLWTVPWSHLQEWTLLWIDVDCF